MACRVCLVAWLHRPWISRLFYFDDEPTFFPLPDRRLANVVTRVRDADNLVQPGNDELEGKRRKEKKRSWLLLRADGV